jgi:DNA-binding NarL/FixJ family response regulator
LVLIPIYGINTNRKTKQLDEAALSRIDAAIVAFLNCSGQTCLGDLTKVKIVKVQPKVPMQILIADDHALFREALRQVVLQLGDDVSVVETHDWQTALALGKQNPGLVLALIDLNMPGMDSFSGLDAFLRCAETVPVVVISASESVVDMQRVFDAGAMGYIAKSETTMVLLSALRLVLSGGVYVPLKLVQQPATVLPEREIASNFGLTPRQYEVLKAIIRGKSNKEIASEFNLSVVTVKVHVSAIFKTLNVHGRLQVIQHVQKQGLKS